MLSLPDIRRDIETHLMEGAANRKSAFHCPVVVTGDADGRIMVLRDFDESAWTLRFHTDVRSPKTTIIGEDQRVGVVFYDRDAALQVRVRGTGRIEAKGEHADVAWETSSNFARRCYLGEGPGSRTDQPSSGLPEWIEGKQPTDEQVAPARPNFAILRVEIEEADWYSLSNDGHRRALIRRNGKDTWLTP